MALSRMTMTSVTPEPEGNHTPWLIVVQGPTAVGKTGVAIHLAKTLQTSILSADARQCYRELNIGTAKPSKAQLNQVTHGFVDTHSIHHPVTAADFATEGLTFLDHVFQHRPVALAVGGSGLYLKALTQGLDPVPKPANGIREALQAEIKQKGLDAMVEQLAAADPAAYKAVNLSNPARVLRALEVFRSTGQSIVTYWQKAENHARPFRTLRLTLNLPRRQLHDRINKRCDEMLAQGLRQEAENLYPFRHYSVLQTVGYQEFFKYLEGHITYAEAVRQFKAHTRRLAKRQITWFRRDPEAEWFQPDQTADMAEYIQTHTGCLSTFSQGFTFNP